MNQEEEARMTFPLRWASMLAPVATTAQGDMERIHREGITMCRGFMSGKKQFPVMHSLSQVKHSTPIKISKESVPCWAFSTLDERQKTTWEAYLHILMYKIFYLTQSPNLDTNINNYFPWKVKNVKFAIISPFAEHTEFIIDKARCSSSLIFHQLSGKEHHMNILPTSYTGTTKKVPSENSLENKFCHTVFF